MAAHCAGYAAGAQVWQAPPPYVALADEVKPSNPEIMTAGKAIADNRILMNRTSELERSFPDASERRNRGSC
jgi:hypothetical protein